MSEPRALSQLPWQVTVEEFTKAAREVADVGACCVFVIDGSIPAAARSGYASLVIAYARAAEPVCVLEDGAAAVLVREGGMASAQALAGRVLALMGKLGLDQTLRAGVAPLDDRPDGAIGAARGAAEAAGAGQIGSAG